MNKIEKRITILEVLFNERWDKHDLRSDEIWGRIERKMGRIFDKLDVLPCEEHNGRIEGVKDKQTWLWTILIALVLAFVGVLLRSHFGVI